jgi:hypothetical protein
LQEEWFWVLSSIWGFAFLSPKEVRVQVVVNAVPKASQDERKRMGKVSEG